MKQIVQISLELLIAISAIAMCIFSFFIFNSDNIIRYSELAIQSFALMIASSLLRTNLNTTIYRNILSLSLVVIYTYSTITLKIDSIQNFYLLSAVMIFFVFDSLLRGKGAIGAQTLNFITGAFTIASMIVYSGERLFLYAILIMVLINSVSIVVISLRRTNG